MSAKLDADVIVIGVGGMGGSACYQLAKRGVAVIGLEQFEHGHHLGSSHGQSRIIRKAYFEHPNYVPLLERSYELWQELESDTHKKLYHETGIIYFCPPQSKLLAGLKLSAEKYKISIEQLSAADLKIYEDRFAPDKTQTCVFEPKAGFLEIDDCVKQFEIAATRLGANIISNTHVMSWRSENDRVFVKTPDKEYSAKKLIVAAGAWTSQILKDCNLPLHVLKKMLIWLPASEGYHENKNTPCFFFEKPYGIFYGFPAFGKHKTLKIAEHTGGRKITDPSLLDRDLESIDSDLALRFVGDCLPGVKKQIAEYAACMYTMTPDSHFIIDLHPKYKNISFACGFSGHGFKFASVVGEILADLAERGETKLPIDFLRIR